MPPEASGDDNQVRMKVVYGGDIFVTNIANSIDYDQLRLDIIEVCCFFDDQPFTMKWVDEEGDPCTISSDTELREAIRLYDLNKEAELTLHVFPSVPEFPGLPCQGEDRQMYRKGAKRWRKFYHINGHKFQAKRFNRRAACEYCHDRIWGLGRQGYKCSNCKLLVHKRCYHFVRHKCGEERSAPVIPPHGFGQSNGNNLPNFALENEGFTSESGTAPSENSVDEIFVTADNSPLNSGDDEFVLVPCEPSKEVIPSAAEVVEDGGGGGEHGKIGLHDFQLLRVIGRGSYAKVLQVEHRRTKRIYAMKVIKKELVTDEEDIDWVQTEKHVFEFATNHPFLVGLHSCFQTDSRLFFVIEFVNGGDLMYHMQRKLRLPEDHARFYAAEICIALNFLHQRGIIYRDLKLDNVLMDGEGHVKLTDYGMCKEGIKPDVLTGTFCGTPNYIAPEILNGQNYSFSVDWWALGVLMFEMLAGRSPWEGVGTSENPDQNTEDYLFQVILHKPIRIPRSISVKATSILRGFLFKDPKDRLGCLPNSNFKDIVNHAFFKAIDWEALENRQIPPPYRPDIQDERDLTHFDPAFTNEPVQLTPDDPSMIAKIDQSEFEGFEYVNPLLMSQEEAV